MTPRKQLPTPDPARVYFLDEVCAFLRMTRRTAERRRRQKVFPIPELPSVDHRARFSGTDILAFIQGESSLRHSGPRMAAGRR